MIKLVTVEYENLQAICKQTIESEANKVCYEGKVEGNRKQLTAHKCAARQIIRNVISSYESYSIELFGEAQYSPEELADFDYLKSLID